MMSKVEFVPFLLTETTDIFSIRINGDRMTELEKFLIMFKDSENKYVQSDLESIIKAISNISENGALESYFRPEGKFNDRVVALPIYVVSRNKKNRGNASFIWNTYLQQPFDNWRRGTQNDSGL